MSAPSHADLRLAELLLARGALDRATISGCLRRAAAERAPLSEVLRQQRLVAPEVLAEAESRLVRPAPHATQRLGSDSKTRDATLAEGRGQQGPSSETIRDRRIDSSSARRGSWGGPEVDTRAGPGSAPRRGAQSSRPSPEPTSFAGQQLGPYRLGRELGRGGMGMVYEAMHQGTGRHYALKTLRPTDDREELERFRREADVAWQLSHPGIVAVHDVGAAGSVRYLVLELLEGGSLQERIAREGALPVEDALEVAVVLADALAYAHGRGVLHRDLKPANVLFDHGGRVRLTDFGLARGPSGNSLTATGDLLGTPAYMAPEQARDSKRADVRSEVYGLGGVLFTMLTGRPPLEASTLHEALEALEHGRRPRVRELRPDVPPALDEVVAKALARDPRERFPDVSAFRAALSDLSRVSIPERGPSRQARAEWVVALVTTLVVLGLVGVVYLATRGGPAPVALAPKASPSSAAAANPSASPSATPAEPLAPGAIPWPWTLRAGAGLALSWQLDDVGLSEYVICRAAEGGLRLEVVRVRGSYPRPNGQQARRDTRFKDERRELPLLGTLGRLVVEGQEARWEPAPRATPPLSGPLAPLLEEALSADLGEVWRKLAQLPAGAWGLGNVLNAEGGTPRWAAWSRETDAGRLNFSLRQVELVQLRKGQYLSRTWPERWPEVVARNGIQPVDNYFADEWLEVPRSPPRGGSLDELAPESGVFSSPWGALLARIEQQLPVIVLEQLPGWARIQWGGGDAYVRRSSLQGKPRGVEVVEVIDKLHSRNGDFIPLARVGPSDKRYHSAASLGQRFASTGAAIRDGHLEVYFDQRRAWFPQRVLGPPR